MSTYNASGTEKISFCNDFGLAYIGQTLQRNAENTNFISDIANCVVNCIFAIPAIVGNAIVIAAILSTPSLRTPSNLLLCSVFSSDLLTGLIVQPSFVLLKIGDLTSRVHINCVALVASTGGAVVFSGNSLISLTFLSVDKWLGLHYHLRFHEMVTMRKASVAISVSWLISFATFGIMLTKEKMVSLPLQILIVAFCFFVDIFVYVSILKTVKRHENQIHIQLQATKQVRNSRGTLDTRKLRKSTKAVFILYTLFLTSMTPLIVVGILYGVFGWSSFMETAFNTASTLCYINSFLNPAIYVNKVEEIRLAVKRLVKRN